MKPFPGYTKGSGHYLEGKGRAEGYKLTLHGGDIDYPHFVYTICTPENEELAVLACITPCGWEHVGVRRNGTDQLPTWDHMAAVKELFWYETECVVQFHPPADVYVNEHPGCLHLWRHVSKPFPLPNKNLV